MFNQQRSTTHRQTALANLTLIYNAAVRGARLSHRSPVIALFLSILQSILMIVVFYYFMTWTGLRNLGGGIRGPFLLYLITGIKLFMLHNKAIQSTMNSESSISALTLHAPMNVIIAICSSALSLLYMQVLTMLVIMFLYHSLYEPLTIYDPVAMFGMFLLAWFSGIAIGMIFKAAKPWFPRAVGMISSFYRRANMLTSGKMLLGNTIPASMLPFFQWNPLFHSIDQARGFAFINYNPFNSSISYAVYFSCTVITLGLISEFYTGKHVSASWSAKR